MRDKTAGRDILRPTILGEGRLQCRRKARREVSLFASGRMAPGRYWAAVHTSGQRRRFRSQCTFAAPGISQGISISRHRILYRVLLPMCAIRETFEISAANYMAFPKGMGLRAVLKPPHTMGGRDTLRYGICQSTRGDATINTSVFDYFQDLRH